MTYGKPIIHFSLQENDICNEYLANYPAALVLNHNMSQDEAVERINTFIKDYKGHTVPFADLHNIFSTNLPSYSAKKVLERLHQTEQKND